MFRRLPLFFPLVLFGLTFNPSLLKAQDAGDSAFDTRTDPAFGDPTDALREFLRDQRVHTHRPQHFCIVGYRSASGDDKRAWVHWTEGHKIILWRGAADPQSAKTAIARSRVVRDLKKDVVATEADIKGSTYLVTRAWVERLVSDCEARGAKYQAGVK
jgi:hypothetical protein